MSIRRPVRMGRLVIDRAIAKWKQASNVPKALWGPGVNDAARRKGNAVYGQRFECLNWLVSYAILAAIEEGR